MFSRRRPFAPCSGSSQRFDSTGRWLRSVLRLVMVAATAITIGALFFGSRPTSEVQHQSSPLSAAGGDDDEAQQTDGCPMPAACACPSPNVPLVKRYAKDNADVVMDVLLPSDIVAACDRRTVTVLVFTARRTFPLQHCTIAAPLLRAVQTGQVVTTGDTRPHHTCSSHEGCVALCLRTICCVGYMPTAPRVGVTQGGPFVLAACQYYQAAPGPATLKKDTVSTLYALAFRPDMRVAGQLAAAVTTATALAALVVTKARRP